MLRCVGIVVPNKMVIPAKTGILIKIILKKNGTRT